MFTPLSRSLIILPILEGIFDLFVKITIIYIAISIGLTWRFSRFYKPEYGNWFTQITIWIFFPITILFSVLGVQSIDGNVLLGIGLIAILIHAVSYLAILVITRLSANRRDKQGNSGAQVFTATFPNSLLYPFPIILAIAGEYGLVFGTFYVFFVMVIRNTFGIYVGAKHSPNNENNPSKDDTSSIDLSSTTDFKKLIIEFIKFPPFIAMIVGFIILALIGPQDLRFPVIQLVKDISLLGSLVLIGLSFQSLSQLKPRNLFSRKTLEVSTVRFIVSPIAGIIFVIVWQFTPLISFILIIQAMGPPAISNILYGKFFAISDDEISIYITSVTFIALLILPLELIILSVLFPF
ncbi:MAG: AEC family transporter [Candidatus Hodarchaeales archaeon]